MFNLIRLEGVPEVMYRIYFMYGMMKAEWN